MEPAAAHLAGTCSCQTFPPLPSHTPPPSSAHTHAPVRPPTHWPQTPWLLAAPLRTGTSDEAAADNSAAASAVRAAMDDLFGESPSGMGLAKLKHVEAFLKVNFPTIYRELVFNNSKTELRNLVRELGFDVKESTTASTATT